MPFAKLSLLLLALLVFSQNTFAAFGNYNSILIGDQAAGMAGAYTAMSDDPSALAWYNPATLAQLKGNSFSAAVGIYKKFDTKYGKSNDLASASMKVNQGFFRALPSSTGNVVRFKEFMSDWTWSFSILVPEYESFKGDVAKTATNTSNLSYQEESLWVGGALARKISAKESVGLSLYYAARSYSKSVSDRSDDGVTTKIFNEERAITQNAIVAILGYHYVLNPQWKFGLSIRLPGLPIAGQASYSESYYDSAAGTPTFKNLSDLKSKAHVPSKYTLGVAWQALDEFLMTMDVSTYGHESYSDIEDPVYGEQLENLAIWNASVGMEILLRDWLKFRTGVFTNSSSRPDPDATKLRGQGDKVDQLGFSANMAFSSGPIQYTFGGYYSGGKGNGIQRINQQYTDIVKSQQVFTMLVGTSYVF